MTTRNIFAAALVLVIGSVTLSSGALAGSVNVSGSYVANGDVTVEVTATAEPYSLAASFADTSTTGLVAAASAGYADDGLSIAVEGSAALDRDEYSVAANVGYEIEGFSISLEGAYESEEGSTLTGTVSYQDDNLNVSVDATSNFATDAYTIGATVAYEQSGVAASVTASYDTENGPEGAFNLSFDFD